MLTLNRKFWRDYKRLFKRDALVANVFLLLAELADEKGEVQFGPCPEAEIQQLLTARFDDPRAYQLERGPKR